VICDEWKLARLELPAGARKASGSASVRSPGMTLSGCFRMTDVVQRLDRPELTTVLVQV
jgi:hypothetical protein